MATTTYPSEQNNALDATLSRVVTLSWQNVLIATILVLAIFTRFYDLGERAMSHDESLHVYYSYELYNEGKFVHSPLMHGPILFHATAFFYSIFGDNDFTARIYTALLGVFMVMSPLLFRHWLGRWGALLACMLILISPLLMYYNRYIRHDTPSIVSAILMAWAIMMYLKGPENQRRRPYWLFLLAGAMLWNLGSKETAFFYVAIMGSFLLLYWIFRLVQYFFNVPGRIWYNFATIGILLAGLAAMGMYIVLEITPLDQLSLASQPGAAPDVLTSARSLVVWTIAVLGVVGALMVGTMLWGYRERLSSLPLMRFVPLVVFALVVLAGFIYIEERSHIPQAASDVEVAEPANPDAEASVETVTTGFRSFPIIAVWVLTAVVIIGMWWSRQAGWWQHLDQFPELDVMIVMGALILPWLSAFVIFSTNGSTQDFTNAGNWVSQNIPILTKILPVNAGTQFGQVVVGLFGAVLPLMIIAIATGLTWNWRRFLPCLLIFYGLYVFFFTTMFTNINGLGTGVYYSLGYWLEQQGERRGNQPQYYYLLIIMPMYEYLPVIGGTLATIGGMCLFWRRQYRYEQANAVVRATVVNEVTGETPAETEEEKLKIPPMSLEEAHETIAKHRTLDEPSFLMFFAWWAMLIIIGLTLAGEKMPWLGTHMTTPLIFLTGWFFGSIFDRIEWRKFAERGWIYLLLVPFLLIAVAQLILQPLGGRMPFSGTELSQIQATNTWLASAALAIAVGYGISRLIPQTTWKHFRQVFVVAVFATLAFITLRAAWMASFINYDLATEYLVYAHASPGTKIVANKLTDLSLRTTNGYGLVFAYDDKMSWPGVWYFREFTNNKYMGRNPTLQQMEEAVVVMVGEANRSVVEPLLEDRYQRFEYTRMWWPMMDYFNLNATRVINTFDLTNPQSAQIRRGLFDIWWHRDYTTYGLAVNKDFSLPNWPVQEKMYMYVRKDIAAQVWQYGVGDFSGNVVEEPEISACVANWQDIPASLVFQTQQASMRQPIGLAVAPDGTVYVAEDGNNRLSKFDSTTGEFLGTFGQSGTIDQPGAFFQRPNSVGFEPNGEMVVVDTWNHSIRMFNPDGSPITKWGVWQASGFDAPAQPLDGFWGPRDVAIDTAGNLYVADTGNKRIRVYSPTGEYIRDIGKGGSRPGELDEPSGIAISDDGRLFVADTWNRRISVFDINTGAFITTYNLRAWYDVAGYRPYIAIDEARSVMYVTDPKGGRVLVYTLDGECVGAFGRLNEENPSSAQFKSLTGIDVDAEGNVYVVDPDTARILKFAPFPVPEEVIVPTEEVLPEITAEIEVMITEEVMTTEESDTTSEVTAETQP